MAALFLLAFFLLALIALAVRRALPLAAALAAGWATQRAAHDPVTACMAGFSVLALCSVLLDRAALSEHASLRLTVRGAECLGGALVAMFLAWSFARALGGGETIARTAIPCLGAAILGGLVTVSRYRIA